MIRNLKRLYRRLTRPVTHLLPTAKVPYTWMGNQYGGFYLAEGTVERHSIIYSFGIGQDVSFDCAVIEAYGCSVYGFDPTPKSVEWVARQPLPKAFTFTGVGIAATSGEMDFHLPVNPDHVSGSIVAQKNVSEQRIVTLPMLTLGDIMDRLGHTRIDVIKMDIEGAEYEVIELMLGTNVRPGQLLIEFHDRFFPGRDARSKAVVDKLREAGYVIFAISDTFEEVSFIHTSRIKHP